MVQRLVRLRSICGHSALVAQQWVLTLRLQQD
jgi:hypothetical protein